MVHSKLLIRAWKAATRITSVHRPSFLCMNKIGASAIFLIVIRSHYIVQVKHDEFVILCLLPNLSWGTIFVVFMLFPFRCIDLKENLINICCRSINFAFAKVQDWFHFAGQGMSIVFIIMLCACSDRSNVTAVILIFPKLRIGRWPALAIAGCFCLQ